MLVRRLLVSRRRVASIWRWSRRGATTRPRRWRAIGAWLSLHITAIRMGRWVTLFECLMSSVGFSRIAAGIGLFVVSVWRPLHVAAVWLGRWRTSFKGPVPGVGVSRIAAWIVLLVIDIRLSLRVTAIRTS